MKNTILINNLIQGGFMYRFIFVFLFLINISFDIW